MLSPFYVGIVVDFLNTAFTVSEGDGTLNLSVQLTAGGIERAFPSTVEVEFSITDLTTEGEDTMNRSVHSQPPQYTMSVADHSIAILPNYTQRVPCNQNVHFFSL